MATFTNQANLTYTGGAVASNIVTGELLDSFSVTKNSVDSVYRNGDIVTYTISMTNTGNVPLTGLTVTDDLGAVDFNGTAVYPLTYQPDAIQYYQNGVEQAAPAVTAGPPLVITGVTVPANGNAQIIYSARVNEFAPLDANGAINNTVTVNGAGLAAETANDTVTVDAAPELSINKAINPATLTPGDPVTYTFTVVNNGNTAATEADNIQITDTFDPPLNITSVTYNGTPLTTPADYTYDAGTGTFATTAGQITVPAANYTQNAATGAYAVNPGTSTLVVNGTIA